MGEAPPFHLRGPRMALAIAGCLVAITLLWDTPVLLPLKWLVVFFHEMSHALMAWATGGRVVALNIAHRESGMCQVLGGNRALILLAGYPGSLCWGLAAVYLARSNRSTLVTLVALGSILVVVGAGWVRPVLGFGFAFSLVAGGALVAAGLRGAAWFRAYLLLLIGATSCAYAFIDIQQDVFGGHGHVSDATLLAAHTGLPFWVWGLLWYLIYAAILLVWCRHVWRTPVRLRRRG